MPAWTKYLGFVGLILVLLGLSLKLTHLLDENFGKRTVLLILVSILSVLIVIPEKENQRINKWTFGQRFLVLAALIFTFRLIPRETWSFLEEEGHRRFGEKTHRVPVQAARPPSVQQPQSSPASMRMESCFGQLWDGIGEMKGKQAIVGPILKTSRPDEMTKQYWVRKNATYIVCLEAENGGMPFPRTYIPPEMFEQHPADTLPTQDMSRAYPDGSAPNPLPSDWSKLGMPYEEKYINEEYWQRRCRAAGRPLPGQFFPFKEANGGEIVVVIKNLAGVRLAVERPFQANGDNAIHLNRGKFTATADGFLELEVNTPYYRGIGEPTDEQLRIISPVRVHVRLAQ